MGTWAAWQIGAAARECDDATWPSMATTPFWLMSFVTAVDASSGFDWSSSTSSLICLPSTPPFLLISSNAISDAFLVEMPKVAMPPVSEPYSPMTISFPDPFEPQESVEASTPARQTAATMRNLIRDLLRPGRKTAYSFARDVESQKMFSFNGLS